LSVATVGDRRRLSIADVMIVVAAAAIGLVLVRQPFPISGRSPMSALAWSGLVLATDFLAPVSFAFLAIRLRPPRPTFRRLARQPGFAACLVVAAASVVVAGLFGIDQILAKGGPHLNSESWCSLEVHSAALAVLGSWITLATAGRWRRLATGGVERLGRLVGWTWLSLLAILWTITLAIS
jgi:hypothetical protein